VRVQEFACAVCCGVRTIWIAVVIALCAAAVAHAAPPDRREIDELYRRGLMGDKEAVEQCIAKLEEGLRVEPKNELARVYLGSAYTLRSRDLGFGPKKLQTLRQGLRVMDEAVANAPNDPAVRLGRALTTQALPGLFGRAEQSRNDFLQLAEMAKTTPGKFTASDLQIVYYNAGLAAKASGNAMRAQELWRDGLRHGSDATLKEKTEAELAKATR
jgi:tetratricopeptide (TPR) repeat protein